MEAAYFKKLQAWQAEKSESRSITIEIRPDTHYCESARVWCYDSALQEGEFVHEPNMPNLEAKAEKAARAEYDRLKAMFEKEGGEI